jgi:Flp pilus assembly protein TadD
VSAIEKALRLIGEPAVEKTVFGGKNPGPNERDREPSKPLNTRWSTRALVAVGAALLWWLVSSYRAPESSDVAQKGLTETAREATTSGQVIVDVPPNLSFAADTTQTDTARKPADSARPSWLDQAGQAWAGGLRNEAAALWMSGLREQSPSTLALLLGQQQTLAQADALFLRWSDRLPVVVLRENTTEPSQWLVLILPSREDVEGVHNELRQTLGAAVPWGSLLHWTSALALPGWQIPSGVTSTIGAQVPAPPAAPAAVQVPEQQPPMQPSRAASALLQAPPTNRAETAAAAAPDTRMAPPELTRATPGSVAVGDTRTATPAARAIEVDFDSVEQWVATGEYEMALGGLEKLERAVGINWRTRYLTGVALSSLGRWPEAFAALSSAHNQNPGHARVSVYLSVAQQELGNHTAALETLNTALNTHPDQPELWLNKGHSLQAMGRSADARIAYGRFMELSVQRQDLKAQRIWVQNKINEVN